ncbi:BglG family transcription antiterminator [Erysipelotrichaceae bacterium 66-17]
MFSSIRLDEIFDIISHQSYTPVNELTKRFQITDRTIRNDIAALNYELKKYSCEILLKRKFGYYLVIYDDSAYQQLIDNNLSSYKTVQFNSLNDRINYILKSLLNAEEYLSLDLLADTIFVSRNTMQNYMKNIKEIFEKYNLVYVSKPNAGIKVIGNEKDIRQCLVDNILSKESPNYIIDFSDREKSLFKDIDFYELRDIVNKHLNNYKIKANDYDRKNLIIHFALMLSRIKSDHYIPYDVNFPIPKDMQELLNTICTNLETTYNIEITKGERQYIYLHIATNASIHNQSVNPILLDKQITELLNLIYLEYNFDLRNDEVLKKDLFNHFSSIFASRMASLHKKNPLLNSIKSNFPLPFEITLTTTAKVFSEKLNEDEIGFVSLHIGAAIERCFSGQYNKKDVILVCGSGIATTRMVEARLNAFFNNKINIKERLSYEQFKKRSEFENIDFVISKIPIQSDLVPVEVVSFALKNEDIEKISRRLSTTDQCFDSVLRQFFDKKLFIRKNRVSKEEIIKTLCSALEEQDIVGPEYYPSVLQRESLAKTNMNSFFAIPHPMAPCSEKTKVAVAILDEPVVWNEEEETVQIIFMLSIRSGQQRDIEYLYDLFIEIVNNPKLQQEILRSNDFSHFIQIISKFIS